MESYNRSNDSNRSQSPASDNTHVGSSPEGGSPPQVPPPPSGGNKVVADPKGMYEGEEEPKEEPTALALFRKHSHFIPQSLSFLFVSAWGIPLTRAEWIQTLQMVHVLVRRSPLPWQTSESREQLE